MTTNFTPREIVSELDRFIIGQNKAKKSVAIALRNRWRRQQVPAPLRDEIVPKNIIMIGPTGVGKTEIARRLARLAQAPFIKVEASKFTEVGYVGKDVESMIRELTDISVKMVRDEETARVQAKAADLAEERVLDLLLPEKVDASIPDLAEEVENKIESTNDNTREKLRDILKSGKLDDKIVMIKQEPKQGPMPAMIEVVASGSIDEMNANLREMLSNIIPGRNKKKRKMKVSEAMEFLKQEEASRLIDMDLVVKDAIERVEQNGIVFLDEIDKITSRAGEKGIGPDVSREGVQRDILPIVEGSTVNTKYGMVRTDHILFIASGAFHNVKPSDMIPELQGRFPIRVELSSLGEKEFYKILTETENSLPKQYTALLKTEGVEIDFEEGALMEISKVASEVNSQLEDIGARRLHTIIEKLLEDISFKVPESRQKKIKISMDYVREQLKDIVKDRDLSKYIL